MAKKSISVFDLIEKYLVKTGVPKNVLSTVLLPAKYEDVYYCHQQRKSNIVSINKKGLAGKETHMDISKQIWGMFFTSTQISNYPTTKNTCEADQNFLFFESNLSDMLTRRSRKVSALIKPSTPKGTYLLGSANILSGTGRKWIDDQNSDTHVHLGRVAGDSSIFYDFRLGMLIDDYLIFLKEKYTDKILIISIPAEYANKFIITKVKQIPSTLKKLIKDADAAADATYVSETTSSSVAPAISPTFPQPAPAPKSTSQGKPKYTANASIGKGALNRAGYVCENCHSTTFTARSTGQYFMEPHHLIPLSCQIHYSNKIDITDNLICLCPNCHSKIHYGLKTDIQAMLQTFLSARQTDLKNHGGIDIDANTLFSYYKI